ncbi:MAG: hypothetical protein KC493_05920 [Bacteriovoracaceae bacterium]|nr:hypothetical protein [Bacteriovoracaceae bacterium]
MCTKNILLIFLATTSVVFAQGNSSSPSFSREALLGENSTEETTQEEEAYRIRARDYIRKAMNKEVRRTYSTSSNRSESQRNEDLSNFNDCVERIRADFGGRDLKKYLDMYNFCNNKINLMTKTQLDKLREMGIRSAIEFENRLGNEILEASIRTHDNDRSSQIEKKLEYLRFDAIEIEGTQTPIHGMDGVFKVINDFTSIAVEFNREQNLQGVIDNNEELSEELRKELVQLNYLTYRLSHDTDPCPGDNKIIHLADDDQTAYSILSDFKGFNDQEFSTVSPKQIFLGLNEEKFKKDVSKYKLSVSEYKDLYLFKHTLPGTQNEVWVMAEVDKTNNTVKYSHYNLIKSHPDRRLERTSQGDITIVGIRNFHRRLSSTPGRDIYLDANVGISLDANLERVPLIGDSPIPTGTVDLAYVKLSSHAPGLWTETKLALQLDRAKISTIMRPNQNANWGTSAELSYQTFDNKWRAGGSVRVHNLLVGVSSNLDDEINMSAGLYRGRSFIIYETNFNDVRKLKVGTAFRNNRGGVYADTDFKKFHNVTLFINLN